MIDELLRRFGYVKASRQLFQSGILSCHTPQAWRVLGKVPQRPPRYTLDARFDCIGAHMRGELSIVDCQSKLGPYGFPDTFRPV